MRQDELIFKVARGLQAENAALRSELAALKAREDRLPADWFTDSSLETWFPLTAEELHRAKERINDLQLELIQAKVKE